MKKPVFATLVLVLAAAVLALGLQSNTALARDGKKILQFDTMVGVPRPYTGSENPIRGVAGGGLPWVVESAKGELRTDGSLKILVEGLVFDPNDPVVIENGLQNQNPIPFFRAIVSCQTIDENGDTATVNLTTDPFSATTGLGAGNATIAARLDLPSPCIAPIVFVTSPGGAWFTATGF